ncbi:hypothetical protein PV325_009025, partial [Microctonus aethiopoides]
MPTSKVLGAGSPPGFSVDRGCFRKPLVAIISIHNTFNLVKQIKLLHIHQNVKRNQNNQ